MIEGAVGVEVGKVTVQSSAGVRRQQGESRGGRRPFKELQDAVTDLADPKFFSRRSIMAGHDTRSTTRGTGEFS